jgi:hypothetical protein
MHPELTRQIAHLRHDELTDARRFRHPTDRAARRGFFRRRRDSHVVTATQPSPLVLLPPPREERDSTGHARRVA